MEKIIELLEEIKDGVDYETCTTLIDDAIFDSFDIIQTINALNDEFDIEIPAQEIIPTNFNSAAALFAMVQRLQED
ncbi:MAG: acyl carrier protein [Clostridia bacterium]|jgi:D-alanine--poly(phosphoribitol) ligase subunit 2|nr:acyl carrier protein [Clostridia bacterium]NLS85733.1 acyl carrier protein [Oscillospiraceae bacterium]